MKRRQKTGITQMIINMLNKKIDIKEIADIAQIPVQEVISIKEKAMSL